MPQQNGVAERLNRTTLVEMSQSMLFDAKLSKKYWAESVSRAVYLRNSYPTKVMMGKTPYKAWFEQKPRANHLRVFGCDAYVHVLKDERRKTQFESKEMCPLGVWWYNKRLSTLWSRKRQSIIQLRCTVRWKLENRIKCRLQFNHKTQWRGWQANNRVW